MSFLVRLNKKLGVETVSLLALLAVLVLLFGTLSPKFLGQANLQSMAFQMPVLGILTLAMLGPIISGGINLSIIDTANFAGLTLAWVLMNFGGADAGVGALILGSVFALCVGALAGCMTGLVIAKVGAHPILVTLAMMIFLRGLGEFLTRGGDISGLPAALSYLGQARLLWVPVPLWLFATCAVLWQFMLARTRHGFAVYMVGSNINAAEYSGVHTKRTLTLIYTFSGLLCAVAGILMAARFNSVRVGHGEAILLITVLACFLGGVDPFGGAGRALPVVIALIILQVLSSGMNLLGANQHLATAVWGHFLIAVMILGWATRKLGIQFNRRKQT